MLMWGYRPLGNFSIKESSQLLIESLLREVSKQWKHLWKLKHWPKISLFLWLLLKHKTLTWDRLQKRGLIRPSIFHLFFLKEVNYAHLFLDYDYTKEIWMLLHHAFGIPPQCWVGIKELLVNFPVSSFFIPILNRFWALMPGFILWSLWNKRNYRIFKDSSKGRGVVWDQNL